MRKPRKWVLRSWLQIPEKHARVLRKGRNSNVAGTKLRCLKQTAAAQSLFKWQKLSSIDHISSSSIGIGKICIPLFDTPCPHFLLSLPTLLYRRGAESLPQCARELRLQQTANRLQTMTMTHRT